MNEYPQCRDLELYTKSFVTDDKRPNDDLNIPSFSFTIHRNWELLEDNVTVLYPNVRNLRFKERGLRRRVVAVRRKGSGEETKTL